MHLSHFPNILTISQISKSFSTFLSRFEIINSFPHIFETFQTDVRHFPHILAVSQALKAIPKYIRHFPNI